MRTEFYILCGLIGLSSCTKNATTQQKGTLVKVNERTLTKEDVLSVLPKNISSADSLLWAESYIKQWVKDNLVYDVALQNLGDENRAEIGTDVHWFDTDIRNNWCTNGCLPI